MIDEELPEVTDDMSDEERLWIESRSVSIPEIRSSNPYGLTDYGYFPDRPKPVEIDSDRDGVSLHSYVIEYQIDTSEIEDLNL